MTNPTTTLTKASKTDPKHDSDYVFYELTRSICPECRRVIDGHVLIRDNKVYLRKRCPDHGLFEGLVYGDAEAYTSSSKFNKPGTIPVEFAAEVKDGCPHDCGLCPITNSTPAWGLLRSIALATWRVPSALLRPDPDSISVWRRLRIFSITTLAPKAIRKWCNSLHTRGF